MDHPIHYSQMTLCDKLGVLVLENFRGAEGNGVNPDELMKDDHSWDSMG